ncbi:MAG: S49 family peptidase, partial [Bernardetiaceae bacterium]|nr:S49 family peptidase [Bernardetiaceae bacterium]
GSIGIFAMLFNAEELITDKLGIHIENVSTGELTDLGMPFKKFSDAERDFLQSMVDEGYENFTSKAAAGRNMHIDTLKQYAGGRVWTGKQALEHGLVDELGGLDKAIAIAAEKAELGQDYKINYYPKKPSFLEQFLGKDSPLISSLQGKEYARLQKYIGYAEEIEKMSGKTQARIPFIIIE